MKIPVLQKHIDEANRLRPPVPRSGSPTTTVLAHNERCPVALAFKEATGIEECRVHTSCIFFNPIGPSRKRIELPYNVWKTITYWDNWRVMSPFEFDVDLHP